MRPHLTEPQTSQVAIVDYGRGNLFSVSQACEQAGLEAVFTSSSKEIMAARAVILPGVGAFGDAMETLTKLDLVSPLRDIAASPKPLIGICLGMQLMMTESQEFGTHRGLGIIEGDVLQFDSSKGDSRAFKIPQVGWNRIYTGTPGFDDDDTGTESVTWRSPALEGLNNGEYMYFVHSYYPRPVDQRVVVSTTQYGGIDFCSTLSLGGVFACQFHPERSGPAGLRIYQNLARLITTPEAD